MAYRFAWCALCAALAACGSSDDSSTTDSDEPECDPTDCGADQFCNFDTGMCDAIRDDGESCVYDHFCRAGSRCFDGRCGKEPTAGGGGAGGAAGEGAAGASAEPIALELPFTPSNVDSLVQGRMLSADSDIVIKDGECRPCACDELLSVGSIEAGCYDRSNFLIRRLDIEFTDLHQPGSSDAEQTPRVVFVRNLIADDTGPSFFLSIPSHPLIVVAQEKIELRGNSLWLAEAGYPGGMPDTTDGAPGTGPGGGGFEIGTYPSGEGGAYCTFGGVGDDMEPPLGETYGSPELVPLLSGSGGGAPWIVTGSVRGGYGGGALQFVAGESIVIGPGRQISVQGGGGDLETSNGPGGGSGGSLLLEAPSVTVEGSLLATGGGGGGYEQNGGKGGDGRIRINTEPGGFTMGAAAVIDPALGTECATMGTLAP